MKEDGVEESQLVGLPVLSFLLVALERQKGFLGHVAASEDPFGGLEGDLDKGPALLEDCVLPRPLRACVAEALLGDSEGLLGVNTADGEMFSHGRSW